MLFRSSVPHDDFFRIRDAFHADVLQSSRKNKPLVVEYDVARAPASDAKFQTPETDPMPYQVRILRVSGGNSVDWRPEGVPADQAGLVGHWFQRLSNWLEKHIGEFSEWRW